ncbi:MAG: hypothetical protein Q8O47_00710 [Candidatus Bathyarchaeota archaeon]|nr:hypothetical protein [Candidatus Bathyarchaeota archaeon]
MSDDAVKRQIEACEAAKGTGDFAPAVDALFNLMPPETRAEIEKVPGVYKEEESYVNRFINMVLISVEFVTTKKLDHVAMYSAILEKLRKTSSWPYLRDSRKAFTA